MKQKPRFPGIRVTANGNQLVSYHTEARIADAGIFYPITPSTEGGELYQQAFAEGKLNVFGGNTIAVEARWRGVDIEMHEQRGTEVLGERHRTGNGAA